VAYFRTYGVPFTSEPPVNGILLNSQGMRPQTAATLSGGKVTNRPTTAGGSTDVAHLGTNNILLDNASLKNAKSWKSYLTAEGRRRGDFDLVYPADECPLQPTFGKQALYDQLLFMLEGEREKEYSKLALLTSGNSTSANPLPIHRHFRGLHALALAISRHSLESFTPSTPRREVGATDHNDEEDILPVDETDTEDVGYLAAISPIQVLQTRKLCSSPVPPSLRSPPSMLSPRTRTGNPTNDDPGQHQPAYTKAEAAPPCPSSAPTRQFNGGSSWLGDGNWPEQKDFSGMSTNLSATIQAAAVASANSYGANAPNYNGGIFNSNGTSSGGARKRPSSAGRLRPTTTSNQTAPGNQSGLAGALMSSPIKLQGAPESALSYSADSNNVQRPSTGKSAGRDSREITAKPLIGLSALLSMSKSAGVGSSSNPTHLLNRVPSNSPSPTPTVIQNTGSSAALPSKLQRPSSNPASKMFSPIVPHAVAPSVPTSHQGTGPLIQLLSSVPTTASPPVPATTHKTIRQAPLATEPPLCFYDNDYISNITTAKSSSSSKGAIKAASSSVPVRADGGTVGSSSSWLQSANTAKYSSALDPNSHIVAWENGAQHRSEKFQHMLHQNANSNSVRQRVHASPLSGQGSHAVLVQGPVPGLQSSGPCVQTSMGFKRSLSEPVNSPTKLDDDSDSAHDQLFPDYDEFYEDDAHDHHLHDEKWSLSPASHTSQE
jgi:hypothetical protein